MTAWHADQIEWIVREVTRRLAAQAAASSEPQTAAGAAAPSASLRLDGRLITLESLREFPLTGNEVLVDARAVVTPAAVDAIRERGMRLVRMPLATSPTQQPRGTHAVSLWLLAATCDRFQRPPWTAATEHRWLPTRCWREVVQALNSDLRAPSTAAIVYSQYPARLVCWLNRANHVRAILPRSTDRLVPDLRATGANVLVVDLGQSATEQQEQVREFVQRVQAGGYPAPDLQKDR